MSPLSLFSFHFCVPEITWDSNKDYSKWNEPLEGFMALHNLQEDGNFKPLSMVTQLFAHLYYHIRGAMLYEGITTFGDFEKNVCKLSDRL
jgi:hypothetical protein